YSMEEALGRLRKFLNFSGDWTELSSYLPEDWRADPEKTRSATASTFAACLELTKAGEIELKQTKMYAPINIRKK
ncbi:MAG: segregation/condensation protein A, partial [Rhodobacteraceae bacterium]|nr:segregation/condensation protein A [Paracoccaceae bacterium]